MAINGEIKTFYSDSDNENVVFPRTITKAISDESGIQLDEKIDSLETTIQSKVSEVDKKLKTLGTQCTFRLEGTTLYIDPME